MYNNVLILDLNTIYYKLLHSITRQIFIKASMTSVGCSLSTDWYGTPTSPITFSLRIENNTLIFEVNIEKSPIFNHQHAIYTSGLWDADVGEIFLCNPKTGFYLEINLDPNGSWWSCCFIAPHECAPNNPQPLIDIKTQSNSNEHNWNSSISIPLSALPQELEFDPLTTTGNITFCLSQNSKMQYVSYLNLGSGTPNFHKPQCWSRLFQLC
jgi:hypothetical protein